MRRSPEVWRPSQIDGLRRGAGSGAGGGPTIARLGRHVVALLAAVVGYYLGMVVGIAALGLTRAAEVAPLLTATVGGVTVGVATGLFDGRRQLGVRTGLGLGSGLVLGLACWLVDPDLEWCVGALAVLSQALAWHSWVSGDRDS